MIRMALVTFISLMVSGCLATKQEPWVFYQAYNDLDKTDPSPFFLTLGEAQEYCDRMNESIGSKYQVGFIAR
tara:strand:- start:13 stop:228 length:216 start_codon:yes stop_codon:yes gene_type:complete